MCTKFHGFNFCQCCLPTKISPPKLVPQLVPQIVIKLSASKDGYCTVNLHESNLHEICMSTYYAMVGLAKLKVHGCRQDFGKGVLCHQRQCWWCHEGRSLFDTTFFANRWWQLTILKLNKRHYCQDLNNILPQLCRRWFPLCSIENSWQFAVCH